MTKLYNSFNAPSKGVLHVDDFIFVPLDSSSYYEKFIVGHYVGSSFRVVAEFNCCSAAIDYRFHLGDGFVVVALNLVVSKIG